MAQNFGRDEMNALLGGATEEMAAFRASTVVQGRDLKKKANSSDPDISKMTAAEAAALLLEKKKADRSHNTTRYRTNRTLAHHELAKELAAEMEAKNNNLKQQDERKASDEDHSGEEEDGDDEEEFVSSAPARRIRSVPKVVHSKAESKAITGRRRRRVYDSSSSDSGSDNERRRRRLRRRERESESSSSSDEEEERQRRRQKARQQMQETTTVIPEAKPMDKERLAALHSNFSSKKTSIDVSMATNDNLKGKKKHQESSSGSDSDSDSSSSGSSSSSDSSSSEEEEPVLAKPIFVPKSKRNLIPSKEKEIEEEEARLAREKEREQRRKLQSRALVAQQVANAASTALIDEAIDEEAGGATNAPPNDDDDVDVEKERDAWEIRELERLLVAMDNEKARALAAREYQRRRQMTDEECMKEDVAAGLYQAPGSNRETGTANGNFQRFFHRGAYYMDEEEWDETDVRYKAADYAKAATGEDKVDKSQLPKIMQVKRFGFARQNHRYKGLANEDTTDKKFETIPIVKKNKRNI